MAAMSREAAAAAHAELSATLEQQQQPQQQPETPGDPSIGGLLLAGPNQQQGMAAPRAPGAAAGVAVSVSRCWYCTIQPRRAAVEAAPGYG